MSVISARSLTGGLHVQNYGAVDVGHHGLTAAASHAKIDVFDARSSLLASVQTLVHHVGLVTALEWAPDRQHHSPESSPYKLRLASGDTIGTIVVWRVESGRIKRELRPSNDPSGAVLDLHWHRTRANCLVSLHATSSGLGTLYFWDVDAGRALWRCNMGAGAVRFALDPFSPSKAVVHTTTNSIIHIDDLSHSHAPTRRTRWHLVADSTLAPTSTTVPSTTSVAHSPSSTPDVSTSAATSTSTSSGLFNAVLKRTTRAASTASFTRNSSASSNGPNSLASGGTSSTSAVAHAAASGSAIVTTTSSEMSQGFISVAHVVPAITAKSIASSACLQVEYSPNEPSILFLLYPTEIVVVDLEPHAACAIHSVHLERGQSPFRSLCVTRTGPAAPQMLICLHESGAVCVRQSTSNNADALVAFQLSCYSDALRLGRGVRLTALALDPQYYGVGDESHTSACAVVGVASDGRTFLWKYCTPPFVPSPRLVLSTYTERPLSSHSCVSIGPGLDTRNWAAYQPLLAVGSEDGSVSLLHLGTMETIRNIGVLPCAVLGIQWIDLETIIVYGYENMSQSAIAAAAAAAKGGSSGADSSSSGAVGVVPNIKGSLSGALGGGTSGGGNSTASGGGGGGSGGASGGSGGSSSSSGGSAGHRASPTVTNYVSIVSLETGLSRPFRPTANDVGRIRTVRVSGLSQYAIIAFDVMPLELWDVREAMPIRNMPLFTQTTALEWSPVHPNKLKRHQHKVGTTNSSGGTAGASTVDGAVGSAAAAAAVAQSDAPLHLDPSGDGALAPAPLVYSREHFVFTIMDGSLFHFSVEGSGVHAGSQGINPEPGMGMITAMGWKDDTLITGDVNGLVHLWDLKARSSTTKNTGHGCVRRIRFAPGRGNSTFLLHFNSGVELWDAATAQPVSQLRVVRTPTPSTLLSSLLNTAGDDVPASSLSNSTSKSSSSAPQIPRNNFSRIIEPISSAGWLSAERPIIITESGALSIFDRSLKRCTSPFSAYQLSEPLSSPYLMSPPVAFHLKTLMRHHPWLPSSVSTTKQLAAAIVTDTASAIPTTATSVAMDSDVIMFPPSPSPSTSTMSTVTDDLISLSDATQTGGNGSHKDPSAESRAVAQRVAAAFQALPEHLANSLDCAPDTVSRCLLTARYFGDEREANFWLLVQERLAQHVKKDTDCPVEAAADSDGNETTHSSTPSLPGFLQLLRPNAQVLESRLRRLDVQETLRERQTDRVHNQRGDIAHVHAPHHQHHRVNHHQVQGADDHFDHGFVQQLVQNHTLAGREARAAMLLMETPPTDHAHYYTDLLRACLLSFTNGTDSFMSTVKLAATSLIANGNLDHGVELLCVIGKQSDACKYLQANGLWRRAAVLARCQLDEEGAAEVLAAWAEHLLRSGGVRSQSWKERAASKKGDGESESSPASHLPSPTLLNQTKVHDGVLLLLSVSRWEHAIRVLHECGEIDMAMMLLSACDEAGVFERCVPVEPELRQRMYKEYATHLEGVYVDSGSRHYNMKSSGVERATMCLDDRFR